MEELLRELQATNAKLDEVIRLLKRSDTVLENMTRVAVPIDEHLGHYIGGSANELARAAIRVLAHHGQPTKSTHGERPTSSSEVTADT